MHFMYYIIYVLPFDVLKNNNCTKLLNIKSRKQRRMIAQRLRRQFSDAKDFGEISTESPPTGTPNKE